jgi:hypothetical protein
MNELEDLGYDTKVVMPKAATLDDVVMKLDVLIDRIDALNYNLGYLIELARNRR